MKNMTITLTQYLETGAQGDDIKALSILDENSTDLIEKLDVNVSDFLTSLQLSGVFHVHYSIADDTNGVFLDDSEYLIYFDSDNGVQHFHDDIELDDSHKALALAKAIDGLESLSEITHSHGSVFDASGDEYLIVTEEEREEEVTEYIKDSLWAFNSSFLAENTNNSLLPVFEALQDSTDEDTANEAILCLIENFSSLEEFIENAISADGYGHFLSRYDGIELEEGNFFIYRKD